MRSAKSLSAGEILRCCDWRTASFRGRPLRLSDVSDEVEVVDRNVRCVYALQRDGLGADRDQRRISYLRGNQHLGCEVAVIDGKTVELDKVLTGPSLIPRIGVKVRDDVVAEAQSEYEHIVTSSTGHGVVIGATDQPVVAGLAVEGVISGAADDGIVTVPGVDGIVANVAVDEVGTAIC